jgi:glycosyltransferase involved in cell wall biosynthesis
MKIVHVIGYFQPELGYEEFYTAREQARMGHDVAVVTSDRIFPFSDEIKTALKGAGMDSGTRKRPSGVSELEGIEVHRLPKVFEGLYDFVAVLGVKEALTKLAPDIVHAHETIQGTPAIAAMHKKLGFKLVVDHHGYAPSYGEEATAKNKLTQLEYKFIRRPLANSAFKRADAVVAVTDKTKDFLVEYHKVPAEKITVLPLAVDTDTFKFDPKARKKHRAALGITDSDILFITTGRLDPAKKLELFIEAFCKLNADNTFMLIIGSGSKQIEAKLKQKAANTCDKVKNIHNSFILKKFMPQQELPGWYSAADAGFWGKASITIIEGMACRLPVILPELRTVKHLLGYQNGCALSSLDVESIKKCFDKLVNNKNKLTAMGKNSEAAVNRKYNYRWRTEKLMEIYDSCFQR